MLAASIQSVEGADRMKKRGILTLLALSLSLVAVVVWEDFCVGSAEACGGLFTREQFIEQQAERIIFSVNGDGTITATIGISYSGAAEDFSWVLPVPSEPVLGIAQTASLDALELATNVEVFQPTFECGTTSPSPGFGGGGAVETTTEQVGPFDVTILSSDDADAVANWLRENEYLVTDAMLPIISEYVDMGMYFVAMKLSADASVEEIQPIQLTFEAEQPMIPIKIAAVAATEDLPVLVWIFADTAYAPENFADVRVDFSEFTDARSMRDTGTYVNAAVSAQDQYELRRDTAQVEHNGLAFVTEYAQPSTALLEPVLDTTGLRFVQQGRDEIATDAFLLDLIERFSYVTRLRAQISPEQMTLDPVFAPVTETRPDIDNIIFLDDFVDPVKYFECSTRLLLTQEEVDAMPAGLTRVAEWRFAVTHPPDWQLSQLEVAMTDYAELQETDDLYAYPAGIPEDAPPLTVNVLAPQPVDRATLQAFFAGEPTPPMFVFTRIHQWFEYYGTLRNRALDYSVVLATTLEQAPDATIPQSQARTVAGIRYDTFAFPQDSQYNVVYGMLANDEQWAANGATFDAMLRYAGSYQYFADDTMRHSLFLPLRVDHLNARPAIPYPEGWYSQMLPNGEIIITTQPDVSEADLSTLPYLRLKRVDNLLGADFWLEGLWGMALAWMETEYNVDIDYTLDMETGRITCLTEDVRTVSFEHDGRRGTALLTVNYVVEYSAPLDMVDGYADTLATMWMGAIEAFQQDQQLSIEAVTCED